MKSVSVCNVECVALSASKCQKGVHCADLRRIVSIFHAIAHPQPTCAGVIRLALGGLHQTLDVPVDVAA